jgi:hypothetical protein
LPCLQIVVLFGYPIDVVGGYIKHLNAFQTIIIIIKFNHHEQRSLFVCNLQVYLDSQQLQVIIGYIEHLDVFWIFL